MTIVTAAVIHKLVKEPHGPTAVQTRDEVLPLTEPVLNLVNAISKFYGSKASKGYGRFEEDVLTGAVNPRYQALHDVRTVANQFISDLLPVNNPYRAILKQESNMLRIIDNLSTKVKGTTKGGKYTEALKKYGKRAGLAGGAIGVYQTIKK